jgi:hypothetical protein
MNIELEDNDNIDLNDYTMSDEDAEYGSYLNLINIFTIYYKTLYNKNGSETLLDEIDVDDVSSTNRPLEMFYDELYKYKNATNDQYVNLFDKEEYKNLYLSEPDSHIPDDYPLYSITISDNNHEIIQITHNLITAIMFVAEYDWINCIWSIDQLNTVNF